MWFHWGPFVGGIISYYLGKWVQRLQSKKSSLDYKWTCPASTCVFHTESNLHGVVLDIAENHLNTFHR